MAQIIAVIVVTALAVGVVTALGCVALVTHNISKHRWNGQIKVHIFPLERSTRLREQTLMSTPGNAEEDRIVIPAGYGVGRFWLCGAVRGYIPRIQIRHWPSGEDIPFYMLSDEEGEGTEIGFAVLTPQEHEGITVHVCNDPQADDWTKPSRKFEIAWERLLRLA